MPEPLLEVRSIPLAEVRFSLLVVPQKKKNFKIYPSLSYPLPMWVCGWVGFCGQVAAAERRRYFHIAANVIKKGKTTLIYLLYTEIGV